jgi:hypothetical protein
MQPTPVKYYVFHFKVRMVHYKHWSPNGTKLAVVTLYFGVLSLPRVGLWRLPYDQVGECWKFVWPLGQRLTWFRKGLIDSRSMQNTTWSFHSCALIGGAANTIFGCGPISCSVIFKGGINLALDPRFLCEPPDPDIPNPKWSLWALLVVTKAAAMGTAMPR